MSLYESLKSKFDALSAEYAELAHGGLTLGERWQLLQSFTVKCVELVEESNVDGPSKKAAVVQAVQAFYVAVIAPLPLPYVPAFLAPAVHALLLKLLTALIDGSIDFVVALFNQRGWLGPDTLAP